MLDNLKVALYVSKVCSYSQGLEIIKDCSNDMGQNNKLCKCMYMWKGE